MHKFQATTNHQTSSCPVAQATTNHQTSSCPVAQATTTHQTSSRSVAQATTPNQNPRLVVARARPGPPPSAVVRSDPWRGPPPSAVFRSDPWPGPPVVSFVSFISFKWGDVAPARPPGICLVVIWGKNSFRTRLGSSTDSARNCIDAIGWNCERFAGGTFHLRRTDHVPRRASKAHHLPSLMAPAFTYCPANRERLGFGAGHRHGLAAATGSFWRSE